LRIRAWSPVHPRSAST